MDLEMYVFYFILFYFILLEKRYVLLCWLGKCVDKFNWESDSLGVIEDMERCGHYLSDSLAD